MEVVRNYTVFFYCLLVMKQRREHKPQIRKPVRHYTDEIGTYRITNLGRVYTRLNQDQEKTRRKPLDLHADQVGTFRKSKHGRMYLELPATSSSSPNSPS